MKQAKTLFLNRAQLYTASGELHPSEAQDVRWTSALRGPERSVDLPEADDRRNCSECVPRIIPRGTAFPLRRFAAIPLLHHIHSQSRPRNSPSAFSFALKGGVSYAVS